MVKKEERKKHSDDIDFEIKFYEGILKEQPDFIEALMALGDLYTKKGMIREGLAIDHRLLKLKPRDPIVLYNLACSYSLGGDIDQALSTMKSAVENGYDDFEYLFEDKDLENLKRDARFKQYMEVLIKKRNKPD